MPGIVAEDGVAGSKPEETAPEKHKLPSPDNGQQQSDAQVTQILDVGEKPPGTMAVEENEAEKNCNTNEGAANHEFAKPVDNAGSEENAVAMDASAVETSSDSKENPEVENEEEVAEAAPAVAMDIAVEEDVASSPIVTKPEGSTQDSNGHPAPSPVKSNPRKTPMNSPKTQAKSEKDKIQSSSSAKQAKVGAKERTELPKPFPKAEKDKTKLPSPRAKPAVAKETEKDKPQSPKAQPNAKETQSNRAKRHSPPLTVQTQSNKQSPSKPSDNPSPAENGKRPTSVKDKDKALPNHESSSPRSVKQATISPSKPPPTSTVSANSTIKTPTLKIPSRFTELSKPSPRSPDKASRAPSEKDSVIQRRASLDGERVRGKVKEFFSRRKSAIGIGTRKFTECDSVVSSEHTSVLARENPDLGPFLLKLARQSVTSGDNPLKALDYATRASKSFEAAADGKPSLDLVMSLHILAAIHCTLGQFEEAIPVLQHSITIPDIETGGQDHAVAAFAGNMQLGDTFALLGKGEDALAAYHAGLEVQKKALGETDPRVGETCRYLAEAHAQAMQFDKAEELCQHALNIHKEHSVPASVEEATDRRLMGLICSGKGQYEAALEHLVLASMALIANGKDIDVAAVDLSIGDTYVALCRYDEAVFSYQKALTVFKSSKGENHVSVASVYVSLAEVYLKTGKMRESKTYCESALRIFNKQGGGHQLDEVASGLTDLAVVYEALGEQDQALSLLKKALSILESVPGQQSAIAGVEAQIGVLSYMCGNYVDAYSFFAKAVSKLRASAERTSSLFGIVLNQMGLCCLHISEIQEAVKLFEESKSVLQVVCGPHHPDTLTVYSNLAGAYDALGRLDEAINALQYVVEVREEELGTAEPEVEDERNRLAELLKEAGRLRCRRLNNTLGLLMQPKSKSSMVEQNANSVSVSVKG